MAPATHPLRTDVLAAVDAEMERVGPEAFRASAIVTAFAGKGPSEATLFRWIAAYVGSGEPARRIVKKIQVLAASRASRVDDAAGDAAQEAVDHLPAIPTVDDVASSGGIIGVVDQLRRCSAAAERVMKHASTEDGKPRNAKLLLAGSEHLRRVIDTTVRLHQSLMGAAQVDRFHKEVIEAIALESPACAERIVQRLRQVTGVWMEQDASRVP